MTTKQTRVDVRLDEAAKSNIVLAAELCHESVSAFVVRTSLAAAAQVIARDHHLVMPAEQFDALAESLDIPDENPALRELSDRTRRYGRV